MFAHWWELALVLILALVFFGPKRLPEIGSSMGKGIKEFRKATTEIEEKVTGHDQPPSQISSANQQTEVRNSATGENVPPVKDVKEA